MTRDRDAWFRRTTWTERDRTEFFARNERSRSAQSKAQYIRIQAVTLFATGDPDLVKAALGLAEQACADFPDVLDRSCILEIAGQCCEALGKTDDAIQFYRKALLREREVPGMKGNAGFRLAKLIVEIGHDQLYAEALAAAESQGPPCFPSQAYTLNGVRAIVLHRTGDGTTAKLFAKAALDAAAIRDSGLTHGRGHLGTVKDTRTVFHQALLSIADA
jgi:hypothetical protein